MMLAIRSSGGTTARDWLLGALVIPLATTMAAVQPPGPADPPTAAQRREAQEIARALRELAESVARDQKTPAAATVKVERPVRTVVAPTLTSAGLDELVDEHLKSEGATPAPLTSDAEFLRRVSLDLTGTPPKPDELERFVADSDPEKRAKQIDRLLQSEEYARNWARYWRDVVRFKATNENRRFVNFPLLEDWLAEQIAKNRPWDEVATELIAAQGNTNDDGRVAFTNAHAAQAVEVASEVSRVFLGVQIQCAQCHDHPTDSWSRRQFHEFAALFAGVRARRVGMPGDPKYAQEVVAQGKPRYTMPDLDDPTKQIPVEPAFFVELNGLKAGQPLPAGLPAQDRRELAASLVTRQDNPWFARAFVNRVWYELMGDAFYVPIDDLGPNREPIAPEVLEALATQWQQGGYDVRWLYTTILNTQAYQRQSRSTDSASGRSSFASNCPSRLRADAIFEALSNALNLQLAAEQGPLARRLAAQQAKGKAPAPGEAAMEGPDGAMAADEMAMMKGKNGKAEAGPVPLRRQLLAPRNLFNALFGVDPSTPDEDVLGTIPQALFFMNSAQVNGAIARRNGVVDQILSEHSDDQGAVRAAYLRVLSREPSDEEMAIALEFRKQVTDRREAFQDLYWALLNSTEFLSRR